MEIAVIEFARSVLGVKDANVTEFDPKTKSPYVIFMPEGSKTHMGGTMRLGSRRTHFHYKNSKSAKLYGNVGFVDERHRHIYEVNPEAVKQLEDARMVFVGKDETGQRMEIIELPSHPFFIGVRFHPELNSRPGKPSPLFEGLIAVDCGQLDSFLSLSPTVSNRVKGRRAQMASPHRKTAQLACAEYVNGSSSVIISNGSEVKY